MVISHGGKLRALVFGGILTLGKLAARVLGAFLQKKDSESSFTGRFHNLTHKMNPSQAIFPQQRKSIAAGITHI